MEEFSGNELSTIQLHALNLVKSRENVFISGPGGSGKSHLIRYFANDFMKEGRIFQVVSTTGASSVMLSKLLNIGGRPTMVRTIHSWSGIRLAEGSISDIIQTVFKSRRCVKEWKRCQVLIIDEISMLSKKIFTILDQIGRYIRGNERPFGGIQIICLGDFFQLSPVGDYKDVKGGVKGDSWKFAFESPAWSNTFSLENHVELVTIFRQSDETFKRILNEIRRGNLSEESRAILQSRVGLTYNSEEHNGVRPMKMFATRDMVSRFNESQYARLTGNETTFEMKTSTNATVYVESGDPFEPHLVERCREATSTEISTDLKRLTNDVPVEASIGLKVGTPVMCLVNLDVESGIANGSLGTVVDFVETPVLCPIVQFYNGVKRPITPYTWQSSELPNIVVTQLPLVLAYGTTIHKMQGLTVDVAEMDLGGSIFSEHQTYVALSRVRSLGGAYLTQFCPEKIRVNPRVVEFYAQFEFVEYEESEEGVEEGDGAGDVVEGAAGDGDAVGEGGEAEAVVREWSEDSCAICLEDQFDKPHDTACKHRFCYDCILRVFRCSYTSCAQCPICRAPISMSTLTSVGPQKKAKNSFFVKKKG